MKGRCPHRAPCMGRQPHSQNGQWWARVDQHASWRSSAAAARLPLPSTALHHEEQHAEPPSRIAFSAAPSPMRPNAQLLQAKKKFPRLDCDQKVLVSKGGRRAKRSRGAARAFLVGTPPPFHSGSAWARQFARSLLPPSQLRRRQQEQYDQHKASKPARQSRILA